MTGEVSHFAQNAAAYPESTVEVFSCSVNYGEYHLSSHIVRVSVLMQHDLHLKYHPH